jgi:hypothetical protein
MLDDLAATCRPVLLQRCGAPTQAFLSGAVEQALSGIEAMCPVVMDGLGFAYGPLATIAGQCLPMLVATPERYVILAVDRYPEAVRRGGLGNGAVGCGCAWCRDRRRRPHRFRH